MRNRNPMYVPHLSFTRHCFTASKPVQYLGEVALVPCKHRCTTSRPVQYPGAVTHTFLIASIYPSSIYPYRYLYLCVKIACAAFLGILIETGWYSESFFVLLRKPHLLCKFSPQELTLFNLYRYELLMFVDGTHIKDPPRT